MVPNWKSRLALLLLVCTAATLLSGCAGAREVGQQVGYFTSRLLALIEQFMVGFIEGCCAGIVAPTAMLVLVSAMLTWRARA